MELFAADGHDAGGCERVTGKSGMRPSLLGDEAGCGEVEDERAVDLLVEGEVEAVERTVGVSESGVLVSPGEQSVLAALEFVGDERGDEVDGAICSPCACCSRVSRRSAIPERRSLRNAWSSSTRFMMGLLFCGR